jgi:DNA-binding beta-propeller fold protein YncE/mono/diheme cytochrome c family protein
MNPEPELRPFVLRNKRTVVALLAALCASAWAIVPIARRAERRAVEARLEPLAPAPGASFGSEVIVAHAGAKTVAFVADADLSEIVAYDVDAAKVLGRTPAEGGPSQLVMAPDGTVYAAMRQQASVRVFRPGSRLGALVRTGEMSTSLEPVALALSPDGSTLAVACAWSHRVEAIDLGRRARTFSTDVPREPRGLVFFDRGRKLAVAHAVGSKVSVLDAASGASNVVPLEGTDATAGRSFGVGADDSFGLMGLAGIGEPPGPPEPRTAVQGFAIVRASVRGEDAILLPEVMAATGRGVTSVHAEAPIRFSGYGISPTWGSFALPAHVPHVAVLRGTDLQPVPESMSLLDGKPSCLLPRAVAVDDRTGSLFVSCLGVDAVFEYDARSANPQATQRQRWLVPSGPTGLALDDRSRRLLVWSSFDKVLTVIDREAPAVFAQVSPVLPRPPTPFEVGRKIFHASTDPRISSDGRACASCHPDGRDDGLTWASPDGPRQTPMLAGRLADTAPYGWTGASKTVREHLSHTFARLQGTGVQGKAMYALLYYCAKMKPPPRAAPDPRDAERIARGRAIFHSYEAGCSSCHSDDQVLADGEQHDVGSRARGDAFAEMSTPSLRFVAGTAPYFHDGRYSSLRELLERSDGKMGWTSHLNAVELDDLVAYLETL